MIQLIVKTITVPKIKSSEFLEITVAIPYPGFVRTALSKQAINQDDQSFIISI